MKNIALFMSIILVSNCFAGKRKCKIKQAQRAQLLKIGKTTCKKLIQNPQTGIVSLVDSESTQIGTQIPLTLVNKSRINWAGIKALIAPKRIVESGDREIELKQ